MHARDVRGREVEVEQLALLQLHHVRCVLGPVLDHLLALMLVVVVAELVDLADRIAPVHPHAHSLVAHGQLHAVLGQHADRERWQQVGVDVHARDPDAEPALGHCALHELLEAQAYVLVVDDEVAVIRAARVGRKGVVHLKFRLPAPDGARAHVVRLCRLHHDVVGLQHERLAAAQLDGVALDQHLQHKEQHHRLLLDARERVRGALLGREGPALRARRADQLVHLVLAALALQRLLQDGDAAEPPAVRLRQRLAPRRQPALLHVLLGWVRVQLEQ